MKNLKNNNNNKNYQRIIKVKIQKFLKKTKFQNQITKKMIKLFKSNFNFS